MNSELILVDDDKILLLILEKMVRIVNPSCRLTSFTTGAEALSHLSTIPKEGKSGFVMLDINLKDMTSWEFMDELKNRTVNCPKVILMTSSVSSSNLQKAKKHVPVIGFFEKPITLEIVRQIFELINKD